MSKHSRGLIRDATTSLEDLASYLEERDEIIDSLDAQVQALSETIVTLMSSNQELEAELEAYRLIERKTGMGPKEIISMVSTLQGTINAIRGSSDE